MQSISLSSCVKKTDITFYTGPNDQDIGEWYVTEIDKTSSEINYNQKQNAVYKMFYGNSSDYSRPL